MCQKFQFLQEADCVVYETFFFTAQFCVLPTYQVKTSRMERTMWSTVSVNELP